MECWTERRRFWSFGGAKELGTLLRVSFPFLVSREEKNELGFRVEGNTYI